MFQNMGKARVFGYNASYLPVDTLDYASGKIYHIYANVEPRLNVRFTLNNGHAIKLGYNRINQYLQLLSNSASSFTAFDVWYPSGPTLKPLRVDQLTIGYFSNFSNKRFEVSVEGYYKILANQIDYRDHARLTFNPLLEAELRTGKGWAYGMEFFLRKPAGRLTGWVNYTWSRAMRQIPQINNGQEYPAIYDQPHKISLTGAYTISERLSIGLNWVYNTGGAINLPVESFSYENQTVPVYLGRNASRLPDYHRLDLSLTRKIKEKPGRKWEGWWVYSFYNVYARKNPLTMYVGEDLSGNGDRFNPRIVANRAYLFSIIPTISFNFKF
jgi:hypothetical protein